MAISAEAAGRWQPSMVTAKMMALTANPKGEGRCGLRYRTIATGGWAVCLDSVNWANVASWENCES